MGPNIQNPGLQAKVAKLGTPTVQTLFSYMSGILGHYFSPSIVNGRKVGHFT